MTGALWGCQNPAWRLAETEHLRIHYRPGSVAAQELSRVKQIYERTYVAARQFLPADVTPPRLDIYLYDELTERGYADPERLTVHLMYGPRYRLTSVHEFLVVMFVPLHPDVPPGIAQGLYQSQSKLRRAMQRRLEDRTEDPARRWPPVADIARLVKNPPAGTEETVLAGALVRFLLAELGETEFWNWYRETTTENWEQTLTRYLDRDISTTATDLRRYIISRTELVPGAP